MSASFEKGKIGASSFNLRYESDAKYSNHEYFFIFYSCTFSTLPTVDSLPFNTEILFVI